MSGEPLYCYTRLQGAERNGSGLHGILVRDVLPGLAPRGVAPWGIWSGLFGVASNELLVMSVGPADHPRWLHDAMPAGVGVSEQLLLRPTVRPQSADRLTRAGLYVFRFFEIASRDIDEFVALSARAWTTFETAADYDSHPEGLFRPVSAESVARMLLCTWYDGLQSWQASRTPAPEARANFAARHALTVSTWALATQLIAAQA